MRKTKLGRLFWAGALMGSVVVELVLCIGVSEARRTPEASSALSSTKPLDVSAESGGGELSPVAGASSYRGASSSRWGAVELGQLRIGEPPALPARVDPFGAFRAPENMDPLETPTEAEPASGPVLRAKTLRDLEKLAGESIESRFAGKAARDLGVRPSARAKRRELEQRALAARSRLSRASAR